MSESNSTSRLSTWEKQDSQLIINMHCFPLETGSQKLNITADKTVRPFITTAVIRKVTFALFSAALCELRGEEDAATFCQSSSSSLKRCNPLYSRSMPDHNLTAM